MAEEVKPDKTKYRVVKRVADTQLEQEVLDAVFAVPEGQPVGPGEDSPPEGAVVVVLLPEDYEGNVLAVARGQYGDGTYGKFPARGFALKTSAPRTVVGWQ